jgi:hypothetical protein
MGSQEIDGAALRASVGRRRISLAIAQGIVYDLLGFTDDAAKVYLIAEALGIASLAGMMLYPVSPN